jgi:hypothetical protein
MRRDLLGESAHLATTGVLLLAASTFMRLSRGFTLAAPVASVAIDLDHIPVTSA